MTGETLEQRVTRLQRELEEAQRAIAAEKQKQAEIVGPAAIAHAQKNPEFRHQLADALRAEVKAKAARIIIADLLT